MCVLHTCVLRLLFLSRVEVCNFVLYEKKQIIAYLILRTFKKNYNFLISKIFNLCTYIEVNREIVRLTS